MKGHLLISCGVTQMEINLDSVFLLEVLDIYLEKMYAVDSCKKII